MAVSQGDTGRQRIRFDDGWAFWPDHSAPAKPIKGPFKWESVPGSRAFKNDQWIVGHLGPWESVELGWNQIGTPDTSVWFRTELGKGPARVLHFDGVDDNAVIYLNGVLLTRHNGWSDPFDVDLKKAWKPNGPNRLFVLVENKGGAGGIYRGVYFVDPKAPVEVPANAKPSLDDRKWRRVQLPHDYVVEGTFTQSADNSHGSLPTYPAWYRKTFTVPASYKGKSVWFDFDGVYRKSTVWLNGHRLGLHQSGYTGFRYDLRPYLKVGGKNVLAVHVDPTHPEGWWYEGGGIYRHVWLNAANPVHVAADGVYVKQFTAPKRGDTSAKAQIHAEVKLQNDSNRRKQFTLVNEIVDANGKVVATAVARPKLAPGQTTFSVNTSLAKANLWSLERPYLYRLVTHIKENNVEFDRVTTPFGVRSIRFDAATGFYLNEQPVKIKGTCNHQDFIGVGTAMPDSVIEWRIKKLKEMGSNAYRSSHNPATNELLNACDRMGMLVMEENRHLGGTYTDHTSSGTPIGDLQDLKDMVVRDRNHPSIIMWSMCNEESLQSTPEGRTIFEAMMKTVKSLDTTRPVTSAMNGGWGQGWSLIQDLQGCNYYPGGYDGFHKNHPEKPIFGSETASAISTRGAYENDKGLGFVSAYDNNFPGWGNTAQNAWQPIGERPYVAGGFVWTGFDYKGEPTPYGWPSISSQFGIMDTCGFPKDTWWWYKANWGNEPVVHLLPHWNWAGKERQVIPVWCHTNGDRAELFLNGRSLGVQAVPPYGHAEWKVAYEPGKLVVKAWKDGKLLGKDEVKTTGEPAALRLTTDRTNLLADGEDITMVAVEVLDKDGHVVPTAQNLVEFKVTGAGSVAGVGNGYPNSHESDIAPRRKAWAGKCMVLVRGAHKPGAITLLATSKGLEAAKLQLAAK